MVDKKRGKKPIRGGASSDEIEYEILNINTKTKTKKTKNTPPKEEAIKQKIIKNCYGCEETNLSSCIDVLSLDHLIDDHKAIAPKGIYAKTKPLIGSEKGHCYGIDSLLKWVEGNPRSKQTDPKTRKLIDKDSIINLKKTVTPKKKQMPKITDSNIHSMCREWVLTQSLWKGVIRAIDFGHANSMTLNKDETNLVIAATGVVVDHSAMSDRNNKVRDLLHGSGKIIFEDSEFHIKNWDTSQVTNMTGLFNIEIERDLDLMYYGNPFSENLSSWNTSKVTSMKDMFKNCRFFNESIFFDTSKVTNMAGMFSGSGYNQAVNFETSKVTDMEGMFFSDVHLGDEYTTDEGYSEFVGKFNQPLVFNVKKVKNMKNLLTGCVYFNKPINLDCPELISMEGMFSKCTSFNNEIQMTTGKVTSMKLALSDCIIFNKSVYLNTINVTDMEGMFYNCYAFNQAVNFDTRNVLDMEVMFCMEPYDPSDSEEGELSAFRHSEYRKRDITGKFNQPLEFKGEPWNIKKVNNMKSMFSGCKAFDQDMESWGTSKANKDDWLEGTLLESKKENKKSKFIDWAGEPHPYNGGGRNRKKPSLKTPKSVLKPSLRTAKIPKPVLKTSLRTSKAELKPSLKTSKAELKK